MPESRKLKEEQQYNLALKMVAPGTQLREGISYILQGGMGALIVLLSTPLKETKLIEGGIAVDQSFSPNYLYELCKMDGAIVLDANAMRILLANAFLVPDGHIPTMETGARHRAAERFAKQTLDIVIAISQRRTTTTLYVGSKKHILDTIPTLLNKAYQALQTLEKYKSSLDKALNDLSIRELEDMVTFYDVAKVVQRTEMVRRITKEIEQFILELGVEGRLVRMQLNELIENIDNSLLVVRDYYKEDKDRKSYEAILKRLESFTSKELLNLDTISSALGYGPNVSLLDTYLIPRGYRILAMTHRLPKQIIENLVTTFGNLKSITQADRKDLIAVEGVGEIRAEKLKEGLRLLRNQLVFEVY